jgi:Fic family protein
MRQGFWESNLSGELKYKSFRPALLPPQPSITITAEIQEALIAVHRSIALLQVRSGLLPDYRLFISMMLYKESLLSSQIEGTVASLEDIFSIHKDFNITSDVIDVLQYFKAIDHGTKRMQEIPFTQRLIKELHHVLMTGQRGYEKSPGEFRHSQNWIGKAGRPLKDAIFVPPHPDRLLDGISNLEQFIYQSPLDPFIKLALIHYQFETIHPFLDGNGRVGRMIVVLLLKHWQLLEEASLPLSYVLKEEQNEYYERLNTVRYTGDFEQWILFFLKAMTKAADHAAQVIDDIQFMIGSHKAWILSTNFKNKTTMMKVYDYLLMQPIADVSKTAKELKLSFNTVSIVLNRMVDQHILTLGNSYSRNRLFIFKIYLDLLREGT